MAYFAQLGVRNRISRVVVAELAFINSGALGDRYSFVETFIDGSQRGMYTGPGHTYDPLTNIFTLASLDAALTTPISAIDSRIDVSDNPPAVERSNTRFSMLRSINDSGAEFRYCAPNARLRFVTDATTVELGVRFTKLTTHGAFNSTAEILVDGVSNTTFNPTSDASATAPATAKKVTLTFGSSVNRTIELLWPYADSMDFLYLRVNNAATVATPVPRPAAKICVLGDSITQGFSVSKPSETWTYRLGAAKGRQIVNLGYGGRGAVAADGLAIDPTCANVVYMIGYNDFGSQLPLNTFQNRVQGTLQNIRSTAPSARIYMVSPIYTTSTNTIPIASYRSRVASAVAAVGDGNTLYVDGLALMTNNSNRLTDGIHPNATGSAEIAASLAALMN
jgi:lysophospholipase L1-like esterase